mgnify:CR=1 FL=1
MRGYIATITRQILGGRVNELSLTGLRSAFVHTGAARLMLVGLRHRFGVDDLIQ